MTSTPTLTDDQWAYQRRLADVIQAVAGEVHRRPGSGARDIAAAVDVALGEVAWIMRLLHRLYDYGAVGDDLTMRVWPPAVECARTLRDHGDDMPADRWAAFLHGALL